MDMSPAVTSKDDLLLSTQSRMSKFKGEDTLNTQSDLVSKDNFQKYNTNTNAKQSPVRNKELRKHPILKLEESRHKTPIGYKNLDYTPTYNIKSKSKKPSMLDNTLSRYGSKIRDNSISNINMTPTETLQRNQLEEIPDDCFENI